MPSKDGKEFLYEQLKDPDFAAEYMRAVLEDYDDPKEIIFALKDIVQAYGGPNQVSAECGIDRSHLYKLFRGENLPRIDTFINICRAVKLDVDILPHTV